MDTIAELVILKCDDETGDKWTVVDVDDVPEGLKDPDVMGRMVAGDSATLPGETTMYIAQAVQ